MIEIWYAILAFMLTMFVVLEGYDIGAGLLQFAVGKNDAEHRMVIGAIGPLWDWHEVWLIGFGGTLMLAFPNILAAAFAGFYLALFLLLWALLLRGISIEVSGHLTDPLWRAFWHSVFVFANVLLAVLIGLALGNVLRGVPIEAGGKFALTFFTNFSPRGRVGIVDWYTLSVAAFVAVTFAAHGATALVLKTAGPVQDRSRRTAVFLWKIVPVLLVLVTVETVSVRPELFPGIGHQPFGWLGGAGVILGLAAVFIGFRGRREGLAVIGSGAFLGGLMVAGAAGVFPVMLRSTLAPRDSLSAYENAAAGHGLAIALIWWPIALVLALGYFVFIFRFYTDKVKPAEDDHHPY
jgi:cytochrome d ubiquinol oxidase subunit II